MTIRSPQKKVVIAIDPGVKGTGIAVWNANLFDKNVMYPDRVTNFAVRQDIWETSVFSLRDRLWKVLSGYVIDRAYIEFPSYQQSQKGKMVARRGDLIKLAVLTGMIADMIHARGGKVIFIEPDRWKGNLKKNIAHNRIRKILPGVENRCMVKSTHAMDAIGIGLWAAGKYVPEFYADTRNFKEVKA